MAGKYLLFLYHLSIRYFLAGSSMVHPNVPAMVICPICPHSLSFRPIVVPAGIELKVKVSEDTRVTAWLSVDGRNRHELHQQDR
jgi:NAD+ kinase